MSTRSQIAVVDKVHGNIKFYKHSDGYPEGVLPQLLSFLLAFKGGRGWDAEYLTARMVHHMIEHSERSREAYYAEREAKGEDLSSTRQMFGFTGFGLGTEWHGDIEYIYLIRSDADTQPGVPLKRLVPREPGNTDDWMVEVWHRVWKPIDFTGMRQYGGQWFALRNTVPVSQESVDEWAKVAVG